MLAPAVEIPRLVFLELEPIDHDRLGGPLQGIALDRRSQDPGPSTIRARRFAVRRPGVIRDAARQIGDPLGLATGAIEQPELIGFVGIVPAGEKGEIVPVRAPSRRVLTPPGCG